MHPQLINPMLHLPRQLAAERNAESGWVFGGLLVVWLLTLIATPISLWVFGEEVFPVVASVGVVVQAVLSVYVLALRWSWRRVLLAVGVVAVITWLAEALGVATGLPFGRYHYTELLQPQLGGVPLIIPLAWLMMLGPAWGVAASVLGEATTGWGRVRFALLAALALTAWDLYLDPQMVARELWVWQQPGVYFGIPLINYAGWVLTAWLATWLLNPSNLARRHLLVIYTFTWVFQAIGLGIFWGQPGPALFGLVGMGSLAVWAWWREAQQWKSPSGV